MNKEISLRKILPVMFGFFIMGFVDIVGVSTSYVKNDFAGMNDTMVNLISLSCFLWFFLLSIPTGMLIVSSKVDFHQSGIEKGTRERVRSKVTKFGYHYKFLSSF